MGAGAGRGVGRAGAEVSAASGAAPRFGGRSALPLGPPLEEAGER